MEKVINIDLIGAGGNGSEIFDGLIKIHHGLLCCGHSFGLNVRVWDDKDVSEANCVRQRFYSHEIGQNKAVTLVNKANMFFGVGWKAMPVRYNESIELKSDIVITCVDSIKARQAVYNANKDIKTDALWLDMGNNKDHGQVVLGHLNSNRENAVKNIIDTYPEILTSEDKPDTPSCSSRESIIRQDLFVNQKVANAASNMLWQLMRKGSISKNAIYMDLAAMDEQSVDMSNMH
ncbi:hypothetical protein A3715_10230 [Oleiphilus sp. HI0009]|nr:hypothetical protein A3715_10230 [Oleiphilus sp. HI0009]